MQQPNQQVPGAHEQNSVKAVILEFKLYDNCLHYIPYGVLRADFVGGLITDLLQRATYAEV